MAFNFIRNVAIWMAAAALTACGPGVQSSPSATSGYALGDVSNGHLLGLPAVAADRAGATAIHRRSTKSWMSPNATEQDLLYVSDFFTSSVDVFSYPQGKQVGTLGGLDGPEGQCTDRKGDVWIAIQDAQEIEEFAHGGTSPIATLSLPDELIDACSVDATSGALAVDSYCQVSGYTCVLPGSVFIYKKIKQQPKQFSVPGELNVLFWSFDPNGDLFVDGLHSVEGGFVLDELQKGASGLSNISLDRIVYYPGGVQWDGKYLAVGDQEAGGQEFESSIHQVSVTGSSGTVVGTTRLRGVMDAVQFWIQGTTIAVPDIQRGSSGDARLFGYPAGGSPKLIITGFEAPIGASVSLSSKHALHTGGPVK
jgi:hypothetical protein